VQLKDEIGKQFDHKSHSFTMDFVMTLGLDADGDFINGLSATASKELMIEQALTNIEAFWKTQEIDTVSYKGSCRIRSVEDINTALDDNQVSLSTMKASRFFSAFSVQIEFWEKTLSHISETLEMIRQVQQSWMYLENIFAGSEDIRRQLPNESAMFDSVNSNYKFVMERLAQDPNCQRATHVEGLLMLLIEMNTKLEKIQKQLYQYLETKRQKFPRFYFLSNEDLLEILGESRDPERIQPHFKKCFEAIQALKFEKNPRKVASYSRDHGRVETV
jgi:dynein heavy chain